MELIKRSRPGRDSLVPSDLRTASADRVKLAIGHIPQGRYKAPNIGARIGCDPMQAAQLAAAGIPNFAQQMQGLAAQAGQNIYGQAPQNVTPDNCSAAGLRYVPLGAAVGAVGAATATSATISPQAPFLPYAIVLGPTANADDLIVTSIKFGTVEMLIGGSLNGELFVNTAFQPGWRVPSNHWIVPGQTIVVSGTSIGAIAANALFAQVYGFTNAPG